MWNPDGVACAAALELGNPAFFFHINHLIYAFLGVLFWRGAAIPMGMARALPALQLFTSIVAAIGLIGTYRAVRATIDDKWLAFGITCWIGLTAVFWVWSVEAQVYSLGFAGVAWATAFLLNTWTPNKYRWAGLLHGIGMLGHLMHGLWIAPALYWMATEPESPGTSRAQNRITYLRWLAATVVTPYLLVISLVIAPTLRTKSAFGNWIKGSLGLTQDRRIAWHTEGWSGPLTWLKSTANFFWGSLWPYGQPMVTQGRLLFILSVIAMGLCFVLALRSKQRKVTYFAMIWIGIYGLLLMTWEPSTLCYRMSEAMPFALLLALGIERLPKTWLRWGVLGVGIVSTTLLTWQTRILPMSHEDGNALFNQIRLLAKITPANSIYLTEGGPTWIYMLYFTGRTALNLQNVPSDKIEDMVNRHKKFVPTFVHTSALRDPVAKAWLDRYTLKQLSPELPWLKVS